MKISFITYTETFLPLICYANASPQGGGMSIILKIVIGLFVLLILAVIWIFYDNNRHNKNNGEQENEKGGRKPIDKKRINENIDLKKEKIELEEEISKKEEEIEMLNNKLFEKENEIASLRRQIMELNTSFSRSSMHSNNSNKQEDNNTTDVDDNNKTNSNPFAGKLNYIELAVINGSLVKEESEQTYYRAWRKDGQLLFEFVNNDRTRKAINNRTIIIEPFCIKLESSKSPDVSEEIVTKTPGLLNDDFTLRKKAEIIYK